jgi:hypothetical protein
MTILTVTAEQGRSSRMAGWSHSGFGSMHLASTFRSMAPIIAESRRLYGHPQVAGTSHHTSLKPIGYT